MIQLPRKVVLLLAVVLIALVAVTFYLQYSSSQSTGPWTPTAPYPLQANGTSGVLGQSCVTSAGTVYCIGGEDAQNQPHPEAYYAQLSSTGIGAWAQTSSPYPEPIMFSSCVSYDSAVYCIGGTHTSNGSDTTSSYFAPVSDGGGLGAWKLTTPYPIPADSMSCVAATGEVFCVGGQNETTGTSSSETDSNSVWYAQLGPSGIGTWSRTTAYPAGVFFPSCVPLGGYVYCVGGQSVSGTIVSSVYYAPVAQDGLGPWTSTSAYPAPTTGPSCTAVSTILYCVGGLVSGGSGTASVYYAGVSPSGVGSWQQGGSYPESLVTDCVSSLSYVYCIGGYDPGSLPTGDTFFVPASGATEVQSQSSSSASAGGR